MNTQAHSGQFNARRQFEKERANDIVVRLDNAGFILDASDNADRLGIDLEAQLLMPHIADFADLEHRDLVAQYFVQVIAGEDNADCVEFTIAPRLSDAECMDHVQQAQASISAASVDQRYSLSLTRIEVAAGQVYGVVGTLRPIKPKTIRAIRGQGPGTSHNSSDPFTGLADRRRFAGALSETICTADIASVAVFAIDSMRAIFMQYGQATADEIRWGFARFLEAMSEPHFILAQIDEERFGVILPGLRPSEARAWAKQTLHTFSGLAAPSKGREPRLSASAGIARAELSSEWTIRQAELGLVMARSAGGKQAAICRPHSGLSNGDTIEQAMETVVEWTAREAAR